MVKTIFKNERLNIDMPDGNEKKERTKVGMNSVQNPHISTQLVISVTCFYLTLCL